MRHLLLALLLTASTPFIVPAMTVATDRSSIAPKAARDIDLVLCLDVSNSMDGLIESAKASLWDTARMLSQAEPKPRLRVALMSYGSGSYTPESGWVRVDTDFTTDLDLVYDRLFALKTNGGTEYVTRVVREGVQQLKWSDEKGALRLLFVAGNEPADQDTTYRAEDVLPGARDRGIFVNTIYCGPATQPESNGWRSVALAGNGDFTTIDPDRAVTMNSPYDDDLARLSGQLNETYVWYGATASARAENQVRQDSNANSIGKGVAAARAAAKASRAYEDASADLVDKYEQSGASALQLDARDVPKELAGLDEAGRRKVVEEKAKVRATVKGQIDELTKKRDAWLKEQQAKDGSATESLNAALRRTLTNQAGRSGFKLPG